LLEHEGGREEGFKSRLCLSILGGGGGVKIFSEPRKREGAKAGPVIFFPPRGFTVPTATSRLGQPTNGGNTGGEEKKQRVTLAPGLFLGGRERRGGKGGKGNRGWEKEKMEKTNILLFNVPNTCNNKFYYKMMSVI
jgi:hypothetical protein